MRFEVGQLVRLTGKSLKGKNRVREHGSLWKVLDCSRQVQCLNLRAGILVCPVTTLDSASRWIEVDGDRDFEVTVEVFHRCENVS